MSTFSQEELLRTPKADGFFEGAHLLQKNILLGNFIIT